MGVLSYHPGDSSRAEPHCSTAVAAVHSLAWFPMQSSRLLRNMSLLQGWLHCLPITSGPLFLSHASPGNCYRPKGVLSSYLLTQTQSTWMLESAHRLAGHTHAPPRQQRAGEWPKCLGEHPRLDKHWESMDPHCLRRIMKMHLWGQWPPTRTPWLRWPSLAWMTVTLRASVGAGLPAFRGTVSEGQAHPGTSGVGVRQDRARPVYSVEIRNSWN